MPIFSIPTSFAIGCDGSGRPGVDATGMQQAARKRGWSGVKREAGEACHSVRDGSTYASVACVKVAGNRKR